MSSAQAGAPDRAGWAGASAEALTDSLCAAAGLGFTAWNECLIAHLASGGTRIRHGPPAADLDGRRRRSAARGYFRAESEVFPKGFAANFRFEARAWLSDRGVEAEIWRRGTLAAPVAVPAAVGFGLVLELDRRGAIACVTGTSRPGSARADLVGWLKVAAAGGHARRGALTRCLVPSRHRP